MREEENFINGYFVAFADEAKELREQKKINTGRLGVFYDKNELIKKLTNQALKGKEMRIVEISVPQNAIIHSNEEKFGFRNRKDIRIVCLEEFKIQVKEKEMAVA